MASTAPTSVNVLPDFSNFQQRFLETAIFLYPQLRQFRRGQPRAARDQRL